MQIRAPRQTMLKIPEILKKKMINMNLALILDKYGYSRNIEEKNDKHEFSSNP